MAVRLHFQFYEILPCNYTMYHKDRNSHGCGVLIAIDDSIPSCCIHSSADLELICVQVGMSHPFYLHVCTVYIPPSASLSYFESLLSFFSDILSANTPCILCGDFNFPTICWDTLSGNTPLSYGMLRNTYPKQPISRI